jgi:hypothetical protein
MVDNDRTGTGADIPRDAPGGRSSRGPKHGTVGDAETVSPPYDQLAGDNSGGGGEGVRKDSDADNAPPADPAPGVSEEERAGISSTEMDPNSPDLQTGDQAG